jgi:hypothetical protein
MYLYRYIHVNFFCTSMLYASWGCTTDRMAPSWDMCMPACCIGARCLLHRRLVALCIGLRCIGDAQSSRTAFRCSELHGMCCVGAARLGKGRALWWPSGGAMHSCAVLRRRALHGQGHRAVRHRGDIQHRRKGACVVGRRCESGRCARGRVSTDCSVRGCVGCAQGGGVVRMLGGAVTFKGGTISNTKAVHAPARCDFTSCVACSECPLLALHVAHDGARATVVHTWCR